MSNDEGRTITLNVPTMFTDLIADSGTLLHEMVHQYLNERGEPAGHDSEGWRREIMRLHELVIDNLSAHFAGRPLLTPVR